VETAAAVPRPGSKPQAKAVASAAESVTPPAESRDRVRLLTDAATREVAASGLQALLLRAARFEVERRRVDLAEHDRGELDAIAHAAAARR
jgi:hypothetical protein